VEKRVAVQAFLQQVEAECGAAGRDRL
jgi:hypothetical protein